MKVICLGDSNTYGYDPRSYFGDRYEAQYRWVDLLATKTEWLIYNKGMNGREVPRNPIPISDDIDLLMIMLGTNDLLQGRSAEEIASRMKAFLQSLSLQGTRILLIAPPPMEFGAWVGEQAMIDASHALTSAYERIAAELNIHYVNAGLWNIPMCYDGVHFTEEGHIRFANELFDYLKKEKLYA